MVSRILTFYFVCRLFHRTRGTRVSDFFLCESSSWFHVGVTDIEFIAFVLCDFSVAELGVIRAPSIRYLLVSTQLQTRPLTYYYLPLTLSLVSWKFPHPLRERARASGDVRNMVACDIVQAEGLGYKSVRRRCMALERHCFSASEAMDIERESGHPGAVLLCATERGGGAEELAGYLLLHRAAPATVAKLAIAPRYRRQGVGRALIEAALDVFRKTLHDECVLQVDEANAAAQRLYESVGFRVCQRREHYYCKRRSSECESGVGCRHALEMRLSLTPSPDADSRRLGLSGAPTPACK